MNRLITVVSGSAIAMAWLVAAPVSAQVHSTENSAAGSPVSVKSAKNDPNRIVCVNEEVLGSRLGSKRHCMTAADWVAYRRDIRNTVDRVQAMKISKE